MQIDIHNKLVEKAKTKKNGIYSYKGFIYGVKDNKFRIYMDWRGDVYQCLGYFNTNVGKIDGYNYERRKKLLEFLQKI